MSPRKATFDDLPRLVRMGWEFHQHAQPEWPWSAVSFASLMKDLIIGAHVTITDGGFMAGLIAPHPLNREWIIAHELLWWATDGSGPRHMRAFRTWAKDQDADEIRWSCRSDNDRVRRFYGKFSRQVEAVYSEAL